jgi:hypothetical protein
MSLNTENTEENRGHRGEIEKVKGRGRQKKGRCWILDERLHIFFTRSPFTSIILSI